MKTFTQQLYNILFFENGFDLSWFTPAGKIKPTVLYNNLFFNSDGYLNFYYNNSSYVPHMPIDYTINYQQALSAIEALLSENGGYEDSKFREPWFFTIKGTLTGAYVLQNTNSFTSLSTQSDIKYTLTTP